MSLIEFAFFVFSRLKLGNEYLYQLNAKGSTIVEVLGMDYKSRLKPALASFEESIKRASMEKLEELISLRQQSAESASKIESKRNRIASLNSHIDEVRTSSLTLVYLLILLSFSYLCKWKKIHKSSILLEDASCGNIFNRKNCRFFFLFFWLGGREGGGV